MPRTTLGWVACLEFMKSLLLFVQQRSDFLNQFEQCLRILLDCCLLAERLPSLQVFALHSDRLPDLTPLYPLALGLEYNSAGVQRQGVDISDIW